MPLSAVLPYVPAALNLTRGIFSKTKVPAPVLQDRSSLRAMPTQVRVNPTQALREVRRSSATASRGATPGSRYLAHSGTLGSLQRLNSTAYEQQIEGDRAVLQQRLGEKSRLDQMDREEISRYRDNKLRATEARSNLINTGINQAAGVVAGQQFDRTLESREASEFLRSLQLMHPDDAAEMMRLYGPEYGLSAADLNPDQGLRVSPPGTYSNTSYDPRYSSLPTSRVRARVGF